MKLMRRLAKYNLFFAILFAALASGCYNPQATERQVFYYNDYSGIASLDPAFAKNQSIMWAVHQVYNCLVEVDSALNIQPSIAKSWHVSEDRTEFTFQLRTDIFFQDDPCFPNGRGRRLTAADVVYSFNRLMDPALASPGAWIFNNKVEKSGAFVALNDSSFQLRLTKPFIPILGILSMQYCSVVPREAVEKYGSDFRRHPVGSGPFQIVNWDEGVALILKKNPHYFEKDQKGRALPYLDGVHVSFYDNRATEFLLFRQGQLDFINDIEASFKDEVLSKQGTLRPEWEGRIRLQTHPYLNVEYLGIVVDSSNELIRNSPLRHKAIRQAINYGFDRRKMILYLRNSLGTPAEAGFVPKGLPSFDASAVKGYTYDPAKTKALLKAAGFPGGSGLPEIKLYTISVYADLATFISKQLEENGIRVQVEVVQKSLLLEMTANSQAAFFRGSWIADYPDAENYLSVFYSKNPAPPNYTRYNNPAFDRLYEQALSETYDSSRYVLYRSADQLLINDAPVVPLWYDQIVHFVRPTIENFRPNALNLLELRTVNKKKP